MGTAGGQCPQQFCPQHTERVGDIQGQRLQDLARGQTGFLLPIRSHLLVLPILLTGFPLQFLTPPPPVTTTPNAAKGPNPDT